MRQAVGEKRMNSLADLRILIVDDFSAMRRIARNFLREIGCIDVDEAADGVEALRKLRSGTFSLLLSDIDMPGMNGFELLRGVRDDWHLKGTPVLLMATEVTGEFRAMASGAGASGYIVKPFTSAALEEKLCRIFPLACRSLA